MNYNGRGLPIVLRRPSLRQRGRFTPITLLRRSQPSMRERRICVLLRDVSKSWRTRRGKNGASSFASSRGCPEPVKLWSGLILRPGAEKLISRPMPYFFPGTGRWWRCFARRSHVMKLRVERVVARRCARERLARASKLSFRMCIISAMTL